MNLLGRGSLEVKTSNSQLKGPGFDARIHQRPTESMQCTCSLNKEILKVLEIRSSNQGYWFLENFPSYSETYQNWGDLLLRDCFFHLLGLCLTPSAAEVWFPTPLGAVEWKLQHSSYHSGTRQQQQLNLLYLLVDVSSSLKTNEELVQQVFG